MESPELGNSEGPREAFLLSLVFTAKGGHDSTAAETKRCY